VSQIKSITPYGERGAKYILATPTPKKQTYKSNKTQTATPKKIDSMKATTPTKSKST